MKLELEQLEAVLTGIQPPDAPRIDRFVLTSGRASLTPNPFQLVMPQPARARATVTQSDLASFLAVKAGSILGRPEVEIGGGVVKIKGKAKVAIIELPVTATCTLEIVGGKELHVRLQTVDVAGGAAKGLVEGFLNKQNPILTTSELPFPVTLTKVTLDGGVVLLEGEALPPR